MNFRRTLILLYFFNLIVLVAVAAFQHAPGYMDAEYYLAGGMRLASGAGFTEAFLWNYMGDPNGIPRPSHAYWMPLASLAAVPGLILVDSDPFTAGRIAFVLFGAAAAPLAAAIAWKWSRSLTQAWLAGLLGVFSGFFLPRLPTTDTFGLVMILGSAFLWAAGQGGQGLWLGWLAVGAAAGGMHLSRADGLLWLLVGLAACVLHGQGWERQRWMRFAGAVGLVLAGYLMIMGPWLLRNWQEFGVPLAPGAGTALWQTEYDDLFRYPASEVSFARWQAAGLGAAVQARWEALLSNLQTLAVVQFNIVQLPLAVWGLWRKRAEPEARLGMVTWFVIFTAMTAAFPFSGPRGGFFHSAAAFQPLIWAAVPGGLEGFLEWGKRRLGWNKLTQARLVFGGMLALAAALVSVAAFSRVVIGPQPEHPIWNQGMDRLRVLDRALTAYGISPCTVIMANNPPGLYVTTGRPGIVIPAGGVEKTLAAAARYGAEVLLLDTSNPDLAELFDQPDGNPALEYLGTISDTRIFRIKANAP